MSALLDTHRSQVELRLARAAKHGRGSYVQLAREIDQLRSHYHATAGVAVDEADRIVDGLHFRLAVLCERWHQDGGWLELHGDPS